MQHVIFGFNTDVKYGSTVYHVQSEARNHESLLQSQIFVKGRCIGKRATPYPEKEDPAGCSEEKLHELLKQQHRRLVEAARAGRIEEELDGEPAAAPVAAPAAVSPAATSVAAPATVSLAAAPAPTPADSASPSALPAEAAAAATVTEALDQLLAELRSASPAGAEAAAPDDQLATQFAAAVPEEEPAAEAGLRLAPLSGVIGKGLLLECLRPAYAADNSALIIAVQVAEEAGAPASGAQITCRISSGKGPAAYAYTITGASGIADLRIALAGLNLAETSLLVQASYREKSASRKYALRRG